MEIDASTDISLEFELISSAFPNSDTADTTDTTGPGDAEPLTPDGALIPHTLWPYGDDDWFSMWEQIWWSRLGDEMYATLHNEDDVDWWTITIPPMG